MDDYHSFREQVEKAGLKIKIEYYRYRSLFTIDPVTLEFMYCKPSKLMRYYRRTKRHIKQFVPYPKGGKCVLSVYDGDKLIAQGVSRCMLIDGFSYKEARNQAVENMVLVGFTFPVQADTQAVLNQA